MRGRIDVPDRRAFLATLAAAVAGGARAQSSAYPNKPITVLLPFAGGSGGDQHMRILATHMSSRLKVPIIINNMPGGNGALAYNALRNAQPDGYTIMMTTSTTQVINPILLARPPFDPSADLVPIAGISKLYQLMVCRADFPAKTVRELVDYARSRPGKVTYASGTSASRLGAGMFAALANIDLLNIPYKSTVNAATDLAGGAVDMIFLDPPTALAMLPLGRIRVLAVGSPRRFKQLPEVPTLVEAGIAGYDFSVWSGLYGRTGTPRTVINVLHDAITQANHSPDADAFRDNASLEGFDATPAELARFQEADLARWRVLARKLNITPE
jgi:tripartite-type tricarboxylate transporter receptor subunit TctC